MDRASLRHFFSELRRRRVYHVAVAYVVVGLGVLGAAELILEPLGLEATMPLIVVITILGFPLALVLAWAYELRPEDAVRDASTATKHDGRKSIIVLPFDNISPDPNDAYLADGLTDELTTHLSRLGSFRVISRNSAMALKGTHKSIAAIAGELGVNLALEGSVRKVGETLRITAQLIDAHADQNLWANRYEGTLDDVFNFQEQASRAIVEALDVEIRPADSDRHASLPARSPQGYEQYLRARNELNLGTPRSLRAGLRHMQAAYEAFGANELILQGMAEAYLFLVEYGMDDGGHALQEAENFMQKLERSSPDSAATYYLRGKLGRVRGDYVAVFRNSRRAVDMDPNNASALINLVSAAALQLGRPEWVEDDVDRMLALDPFNPLALLVAGHQRLVSGKDEAALAAFHKAIELEPDFVHARVIGSAFVHSWQGRAQRAIDELEPISQDASGESLIELAAFLVCALRDDPGGLASAMSKASRDRVWVDPEGPYFMSSAFALAGDADNALRWLEHALERGWANYPLVAEIDPHFAGLREKGEFRELLARFRLRWEEAGSQLS